MEGTEGLKTQPIIVKPKYIAQRCPVCNGFGTLRYGTKICQGCSGKGWVLIPNEINNSNKP